MRLGWLILFLFSHMLHAFALEVILDPYADLSDEITAYDYTQEKKENFCVCDCDPIYYPIFID